MSFVARKYLAKDQSPAENSSILGLQAQILCLSCQILILLAEFFDKLLDWEDEEFGLSRALILLSKRDFIQEGIIILILFRLLFEANNNYQILFLTEHFLI